MNNSKVKRSLFMLLAVLLIVTMVPSAIFAADSTSSPVEVRLKVGSSTVQINGTPMKVQAPYETNGTTMVPLSVITKAFGATLKLQDNKVITLTYNDKKVVVTIGSKTVKVNNTSKTVAVAPVILKNTTMVPVRVIVEAFGANIGKDTATKETVITGVRANSTGGDSSIDSDYGKTLVGDSYMNWSMNYPPGLVQNQQSDSGDYVNWSDAKTGATVIVSTESVEDELTTEEKRDMLYDWLDSDEIVLDKRTITVEGLSFEKIVTRAKEQEMVYEYRGIQQGELFYVVMGGVAGTVKSNLDAYQALLNSFKPSFDKSNKALKDITKVIDGQLTFHDEDYGLKVKLPVDWYQNPNSTIPEFYSEDGLFSMRISSLLDEDTVEEWLQRRQAIVREDFVPAYIRNEKTSSITLKNGEAQVLQFEYTYDQKTWTAAYEVFLIVGEYRYSLDLYYDMKPGIDGENFFRKTMASVELDTQYIEDNFGLVEDEYAVADRTKKVAEKSKDYSYSLELPASWYAYRDDFEYDYIEYDMDTGYMAIEVLEDTDMNTAIANIKESYEDEGYSLISDSSVTIGGKTGSKYIAKFKDNYDTPQTEYNYFVEHNGNTLVFLFSISDANATPSTLTRIADVIASIKFT